MSWAETKIILDAITENGINSSDGTIMMVPFTENHYGFYVEILDIDGVTPLPNVLISGVTDPTTEIRTNADGIAKFVSSSPTHTVTFSEFPDGYEYSTAYVSQTIQGYINNMTKITVAPDISEFAGYNVTLLNYYGNALSNATVTCSNGASYTTNSSGGFDSPIYSTATSLTFTSVSKSPAGTFTWSASGTVGSITTETLSASGTPVMGTIPSAGDYITIGSYQYLITYLDSNYVYALLRYHTQDTQFGGSVTYSDSTIASLCSTWYSSYVPSSLKNTYNVFASATVNGVSAQCFIPSYEQLGSTWTYMANSATNRIFYNSSGTAQSWWTSSQYSSSLVWGVITYGGFDNRNPTYSNGFRPCLRIRRAAFATS